MKKASQRLKKVLLFPTALFAVFALAACSKGNFKASETVAASSLENLGCKTSQSAVWNSLHAIAETEGSYPAGESVEKALRALGQQKGLSGAQFERYVAAFVGHYQNVINGIQLNFAPTDIESWKKALAEMEVGVRITEVHAKLTNEIAVTQNKLNAAETDLNVDCTQPQPPAETPPTPSPGNPNPENQSGNVPPQPPPGRTPASQNLWDSLAQAQVPEVVGARRTLAVAYQSCDAAVLQPMTDLTPAVRGVEIYGDHPSGGKLRRITSVADVAASHYYVRDVGLAKPSCFNVDKDPLIYNFGGKPATSADDPYTLNMFKRVGSGGPTLGIDCSAYVFSALATAGLRMDPNPQKVLTANLVWGIGSSAFKEPQDNGLRCLQKISVDQNQSILPGDIIAIKGHVVMIDEVGSDPFHLKKLKSVDDCNSSKLKPEEFDFVIAQSAPIKNGIGIDRIHFSAYSSDSNTISQGVLRYAIAACRAKFGAAANLSSPNLSIVRHKRTAACLDKPLKMTNASCVDSCLAK